MSELLLKRLQDQRLKAVTTAREIAERAASGEETAEDEAAYTTANVEISRLGALMTDERKRMDDEAEYATAFAAAERAAGLKPETAVESVKAKTWREEAREAIKASERRSGGTFEPLPDRQRHAELRALAIGTSTQGPEVIAPTLVQSLFQKLFDDSGVLSAGVQILRTGTGEAIKFPRLTALGALSQANARRDEAATIQKGEPTFDQVELDAYKYGQISQATREVIEDAVVDIEGLLGTVLGRNMANYLGYDLTLGTGTGMPRGVTAVVPSGNKVTGATGKVGKPTDMDTILDIIAKLAPGYRRNAKFLMNDLTTFALRKFKVVSDGTNNYAWQPAVIPGADDTLMGYPLRTDPYIAVTALNALSIVFADFSMYYVRMINDVRVEWSTEYAWDTDLVSVKAVLRADGDAIDDSAFAGFVGGAS